MKILGRKTAAAVVAAEKRPEQKLQNGKKLAWWSRCEADGNGQGRVSRSVVVKTGVAAISVHLLTFVDPLYAAVGIGRYVKKRALEPLQNYVLPLLAARSEIERAGRVADEDLDAARSLLREGSLSSLRVNARAVGEYAERLETSSEAPELVTGVTRSIEKFDSYLLQASRNQRSKKDPTEFVVESVGAIDKLLKTVPQDVMDDATGIPAERKTLPS